MPSSITTDIAIIGAGTAGLTAFSELRRLGLSAVLIDHALWARPVPGWVACLPRQHCMPATSGPTCARC